MKTPRRYIFIAVLLCLFTRYPAYAQFIAHIEQDSIVTKMVSYQLAISETQAYENIIIKQIEGKEAEIMSYYMGLEEKAKKGILTPIEEKEASKKIEEMKNKFQLFEQEKQLEFENKRNELFEPVLAEYNKAIKDVCKENNYIYLIEKRISLYSDGGIDATEKVKAKLGIK
jgi:outer membrane protein